jgi:hypothetical protein
MPEDIVPPLFGFAPGGVCLAKSCCQDRGALLPHLFTLTHLRLVGFGGRFVSVALSLGLPPPGVTRHPNPVEPGLSSPAVLSNLAKAAIQPTGLAGLGAKPRAVNKSLVIWSKPTI